MPGVAVVLGCASDEGGGRKSEKHGEKRIFF